MSAERPPRPGPPAPAARGLVMRERDRWVIAAEPDVMIRIKRIFLKVDRAEFGQVAIARSPEVDRDLQWFLDRYPMTMSTRDAAELHRGAEEHRALGRLVQEMRAEGYTPAEFAGMAVTPRDYQRLAADMGLRLKRLLLGDDTGVGKTISALTMLSDPRTLPALVACPPGNMPIQWREQFARCLPGLRVFTCSGQRASMPSIDGKGWPDVVICPYHLLEYWADLLAPRIKTVIYDEVQALRHPDTGKYKAASALSSRAEYILGMSATPDYAYGAEYFAVLDVVNPGSLGTWDEFDREWCLSGGERRKKAIKDPRAFGFYLDQSGLRLRRTRKDVGRELPPLTIAPTTIQCDPDELRRVAGRASELARILVSQTLGSNARFQKMRAGGELDRIMRQATGIGKAPFIADFVRLLVENGESVLVGVHHRSVYDILMQKLREDFAPAVYSGEETNREKQESLRRFKAKETPILIMGLRVGSEGLDGLQHVCRTAVIGELDWSPQLHHQFISRIDRDGQTDKVTAYYLLSDEGSDPIVADVCGAKRARTVVIADPDEARRTVEEVDAHRAAKLAAAHLARR